MAAAGSSAVRQALNRVRRKQARREALEERRGKEVEDKKGSGAILPLPRFPFSPFLLFSH
jgi:Arc/MetJ-type ribon-helix-helix transcriptional regulator